MDCYGRSQDNCCRVDPSLYSELGYPVDHPRWENHCYAKGSESADLIGTFTWRPAVGGCPAGYYGALTASHAEIFFTRGGSSIGLDQSYITAWDGINIPGVGNVSGAAVGEPIARRASGAGGGLVTHSNVGVSTCSFDSGVNKNTTVASEFVIPKRLKEKHGYDEVDLHLGPVACKKELAGTTDLGAACVRPIYPNLVSEIAANSSHITRVDVNKRTTYPEIMTVHRIQCTGDGYALHVSREHYEHDRVAYGTQKFSVPGNPPTLMINKYPIFGKLLGGKQGVLYEDPEGAEDASHYFKICDTGDLPETAKVLEYLDYPINIPMAAQSDFVSPCYENQTALTCVTGIETFKKSTCISYYDPESYEETSGGGATGYLQSNGDGSALQFILTNPGSGYYVCNDPTGVYECIGCAKAIFDNPCVNLYLSVARSGVGGAEWVIQTGVIDYGACGTVTWPECCDELKDGSPEEYDCENDSSESYCGGSTFPPDTTYPIKIIGCDAVPKLLCAGLTTEVCASGDPKYPNFYNDGSGTALWNHYNLVYDYHVLDYRFLTDSSITDGVMYPSPPPGDRAEPFPKNETGAEGIYTGFVNGSLRANESPLGEDGDESQFTCSYSCLQDNLNCGGGFFNNKEFFPRRSYLTGTKVTRYGPLSVCAQNAQLDWGSWLGGHVDLSSSIINTKEMGKLDDVKYIPLVDPSKPGAYTLTTQDMSIEDEIIYVEELTTLLGAQHPFFRLLNPQSLDSKSCIMPDSGCFHFLPIHNDSTALGMDEQEFYTGDNVYFTNRDIIREAIANNLVGTSGCLLNPFKIMVDVEPCNERLSHPGTSYPMNLSWVVNNIPAGVCNGWLYQPSSSCGGGCDRKVGLLGKEATFGPSSIVKLYSCAGGYLDSEPLNGFCSWDPISQGSCNSAPETPGACPEVTITEYFVWKGKDGIEYIYLGASNTYKANDPHMDITGGWVDMSCYKSWGMGDIDLATCGHQQLHRDPASCHNPAYPFCDELPEGVIPDSSPPGQNCVEPNEFYYGPLIKQDLEDGTDRYGANNFEDGVFCKVIRGSTNFEIWKAAVDEYGCPNGTIRGYRDFVFLGEPCALQTVINREYGCYAPDSIQECPFPSVIKVTITE
jgi:hypothetical protein